MKTHRTLGFKLEKLCRMCRKNRRGTAAVEFAIIAPVFFLLVFGMIEIGRAVMVQQIMLNASREGARSAVLDGATSTDVEADVEAYLENATIEGATITITPSDLSSAGYGDPVTVAVAIPFDQVSWLGSPINLQDFTLRARTVMRRETVQ